MTLILKSTQKPRLEEWGSFFVKPQAASFHAHSFGSTTNFGRI